MAEIKVIKDRKKFSEKRVKQIPNEFILKKIVCESNKCNYKGILALDPIDITAKCAHHEVAIHGIALFAYVPNEYLIGLSQVARIIESFLNPTIGILQEEATKQISDYIEQKIRPSGMWLVIKAKHDCMCSRGVKQRNTRTTTSELRGTYMYNSRLVDETKFLWSL